MSKRPPVHDLVELLEYASESPYARFSTWQDADQQPDTAHAILDRSLRCAGALRHLGLADGDAVLVALGNSVDFVVSFFGIMAAGGVPVALPWPGEQGRNLRRFQHVAADSNASLLVGPSGADTRDALTGLSTLQFVSPEDLAEGPQVRRRTSGTAFLQYTSGSTGLPKAVAPTHSNVLAQLRLAAGVYHEETSDCSVTWVPLFHDMGLVTGILRPLYSGYRSVLMEPEDFVRSPHDWLLAMTNERATLTSAPNFGYDICTRKATTSGLDLTHLRVARNAGETVRQTTVLGFTEKFGTVGFRPEAMCPSYGLAEAVLTLASSTPEQRPRVIAVSRADLEQGRVSADSSAGNSIALVSSGFPLPETTARIVGPTGEVLPPGAVGEIVMAGPQVVTPSTAEDAESWVPTGDSGFLWEGEVVVLGRSVEKLSIRGRTLYVAEIERFLAEQFSWLRPGRIAVVPDADEDSQAFTVLAEATGAGDHYDQLARDIRRTVIREFGANPRKVELGDRGTVPLTSSGKIARAEVQRATAVRPG